ALSDEGYHVRTVNDGAAALRAIPEYNPALIMTDMRMPGMDGWTLIEQLKQELRSQKVNLPSQSSSLVVSAEPEQPAPSLPERSVQSQKPGKRRIIYEER
ncbi:MAG: response regulator, partial [Microcoleus sp. SIO2G3]|nr:response regulator [Microcoleus sp. SIO2G3]